MESPGTSSCLVGGKYRLGKKIGAGFQGEVFECVDVTTGKVRKTMVKRRSLAAAAYCIP